MAKSLRKPADKDEKELEVKEEVKEEKEDKEEEKKEVEIRAQKVVKMPNVRIKPNTDLRTYIGDQWYNLKKGVQTNVPQNVKEILARAGLLDPL